MSWKMLLAVVGLVLAAGYVIGPDTLLLLVPPYLR